MKTDLRDQKGAFKKRPLNAPPTNAAQQHAAQVDKEYAELCNAAWHARTTRLGSELEAQAVDKITEQVNKLQELGCELHQVLGRLVHYLKS